MGLRSGLGERLIQHLDERRAIISVRLTFVELHELLDLLADRHLGFLLIGNHHVAALRVRLRQCLLDRSSHLIGLLIVGSIHARRKARRARRRRVRPHFEPVHS